jgi:hypothetical protein
MKFKNYLNEKTFAIGADVDYIYKKYFKKAIDDFKKGKKETIVNFPTSKFSTDDLKSQKAKKAHEINPLIIYIGIFDCCSYNPVESIIRLTFNMSAVNLLKANDIKKIKYLLSDEEYKRYLNEFSSSSIKGSIYHELSHWLNDTFHNKNILKRIQKSKNINSYKPLTRFNVTVFSDYELDAQVHALKQLKRDYKKDWDDLTWNDVIIRKPSFDFIKRTLKSSSNKARNDYKKRLLKRLNREKLLGKGLKNSFNDFYKD